MRPSLQEFRRLTGLPPLRERLSAVLYHRTELDAVEKILATDEFVLATSAGTQSDDSFQPREKLYYLSTARSPTGHYDGAVTLVLDGDKLGQRYSGKPVDYWGPEFRKVNPRGNEVEDRLYSDKPTIPKAASYITSIHVLVDPQRQPSGDYAHFHFERMRAVFIDAKKRKIPIYAYDDEQAYRLLNKAKSLPFDKALFTTPPGEQAPAYQRTPKSGHYIPAFVELWHLPADAKLSPETAKLWSHLWMPDDALRSLEAEVHNDKKTPRVRALVQILQKERMSLKDFVLAVFQKWRPR